MKKAEQREILKFIMDRVRLLDSKTLSQLISELLKIQKTSTNKNHSTESL